MTQFTTMLQPWSKRTFVVLALVFFHLTAWSQTYLTGTVKDDKEALIGASIKVFKDNVVIRGGITDYEGNFRIAVDPGTYDVEVGYTGYQTQRITGVIALAGKLNSIPDIIMANAVLSEVVISAYRVPLIERDMTSSGQTLTQSDLKRLSSGKKSASKSSKKSAAKSAKPRPTSKSESIAIKGSRSLAGKKAKAPQKTEHLIYDDYNTGQYQPIVENPFQDAKLSNISTFSIDVDAAAYANVRRHLNGNRLPPKDAVRLEEMINYFDYNYQKPVGPHPFEVNTEVAPCPWNPQNRLMLIGIQGTVMDVGQLPASNLVFLIDVSGSMGGPDRLPLVKRSLEMLADQLRPNDRVAMVVYAGAAGVVLESTSGTDKATIKAALAKLEAGGSTAGGAGIKMAYEIAKKYFVHGGNNRVILCTDGDFNVGVSSDGELVKLIEEERKSGVYLTVLGYGMGNYQDGKMQQLADKGNGNHAYIDQLSEANKVLTREFGGTLFAIAKDVKLQLHFNPEQVAGYRLIGYENRLLATEDFHDDAKDAGELGAGHRVTALYELIPTGQGLPPLTKADSALVVVQKPNMSVKIRTEDLMVLQMRYKRPTGNAPSQLLEYRLNAAAMDKNSPTENFKLAAAIAEFGLLLRDSKFKGSASYERAIANVKETLGKDAFGYRAELVLLMEKAASLATTH